MANQKSRSTEGVGFLLGSIARARRLWFRGVLAPYGITLPQAAVLLRLGERDGLSVGELADRLFADPTTLGRTVGRMERDGLLTRVRPERDRRICRLWLTERGRELGAELQPHIRRAERQLLRGLDDGSVRTLKTLLRAALVNAARDVGFDADALDAWGAA